MSSSLLFHRLGEKPYASRFLNTDGMRSNAQCLEYSTRGLLTRLGLLRVQLLNLQEGHSIREVWGWLPYGLNSLAARGHSILPHQK